MSKKLLFAISAIALFNLNAFAELDMSKLVEANAENKERCVEFYMVNQKMYCSTTPLSPTQTNVEAVKHEKLQVVFDDRQWTPGWGKHDASMTTVEYVPEGQNVEHWNELITTQFQSGLRIVPEAYANFVKQNLMQKGYNPVFKVYEQTPQEVVFEFKIAQPAAEAQNELQRMIVGQDGLYFVHYAMRGADMPEANREKWLNNLKAVTLK